MKIGDLIVAVDGTKTPDADSVRRQLRRGYISGEAVLAIRRGNGFLDLRMPFYEFESPVDAKKP